MLIAAPRTSPLLLLSFPSRLVYLYPKHFLRLPPCLPLHPPHRSSPPIARSLKTISPATMPARDKYTDPELRDQVKEEIHNSDKGGAPGQWSARKVISPPSMLPTHATDATYRHNSWPKNTKTVAVPTPRTSPQGRTTRRRTSRNGPTRSGRRRRGPGTRRRTTGRRSGICRRRRGSR